MILRALIDHYEALDRKGEISKPGWGLERVSFALVLSAEGELKQLVPLVTQVQQKEKTVERPQTLTVPERIIRTVGIDANFLCDNSSYVFGFDEKGKPARSAECFDAAAELHKALLEDVDHPAAQAICKYFATWAPYVARTHAAILPYLDSMETANFVFMVGGEFAHDIPELKAAWQRHYDDNSALSSALCLATGQVDAIPSIHGKIKGVRGAQSGGASLISYNAAAYHSYGVDEGQADVPIGAHAAFAYVAALNHLLADQKHNMRVGDTTVVYWAANADPRPQEAFSFTLSPPPDGDAQLSGIMANVKNGLPVAETNMDTPFYILGLAPNAGRISVRFFHVDSFGNILKNLCAHYERLEIARPSFDQQIYLPLWQLLGETVNPNSKDKSASPLLAGALMQAVITGRPYPSILLSSVMTRIRAEKNISRGKAAIIKACLLKNEHGQTNKEVLTVSLNEETNNRAYVLGRLFALLEQAQQEANPGINTTIKDSYLTSACATPGSVFPLLLKLSVAHTKKAAYGGRLEQAKGELMGKLCIENDPFPAHMSLQEQGEFMLGYYHQTQARYTKKEKDDITKEG